MTLIDVSSHVAAKTSIFCKATATKTKSNVTDRGESFEILAGQNVKVKVYQTKFCKFSQNTLKDFPLLLLIKSSFFVTWLSSCSYFKRQTITQFKNAKAMFYYNINNFHDVAIIKSNQIFHYTRCFTPKRVTSWRGPSPRHCARATQLLSKKCRSGGEPLATLCLIWPARDLNLRPPAPETNALPLDQLAGKVANFKTSQKNCICYNRLLTFLKTWFTVSKTWISFALKKSIDVFWWRNQVAIA